MSSSAWHRAGAWGPRARPAGAPKAPSPWLRPPRATRTGNPDRSSGFRIEVPQRLPIEDGDAGLRIRELRFAEAQQLGTALVRGERFLEGKPAVLHAPDEGFEL